MSSNARRSLSQETLDRFQKRQQPQEGAIISSNDSYRFWFSFRQHLGQPELGGKKLGGSGAFQFA